MEEFMKTLTEEMDEVQLRDTFGAILLKKYKDKHVAKVTVTVNLEKEETNIVLKY
jgi:hypothetical protein